jgi:hypothetical protein
VVGQFNCLQRVSSGPSEARNFSGISIDLRRPLVRNSRSLNQGAYQYGTPTLPMYSLFSSRLGRDRKATSIWDPFSATHDTATLQSVLQRIAGDCAEICGFQFCLSPFHWPFSRS